VSGIPATRHSAHRALRLVPSVAFLAVSIVSWSYCGERASTGTYALRISNAHSARSLVGFAHASGYPPLNSTSDGFDIFLYPDTIQSAAPLVPPADSNRGRSDVGGLRSSIRLYTRRIPATGTYRVVDRTMLGVASLPPRTVHVSYSGYDAGLFPSGTGGQRWQAVGGTVGFVRPRWWSNGLDGALRLEFALVRDLVTDTVTVTGTFTTRWRHSAYAE
jgi:hypothetical protein